MESASRHSSRRPRVVPLPTERLLEGFFCVGQRLRITQPRSWEPRADVYETETELVIQIELSAVAREDVSLYLEGDRLILRGTRSTPMQASEVRYHQMEIPCGSFERVFQIPPQLGSRQVEAKLKDGLLTVTVRK